MLLSQKIARAKSTNRLGLIAFYWLLALIVPTKRRFMGAGGTGGTGGTGETSTPPLLNSSTSPLLHSHSSTPPLINQIQNPGHRAQINPKPGQITDYILFYAGVKKRKPANFAVFLAKAKQKIACRGLTFQ